MAFRKKKKKNRRRAVTRSGLPSIREFQEFVVSFMKVYNLKRFEAELTDIEFGFDFDFIEDCEDNYTDIRFMESIDSICMFMELCGFTAIEGEASENGYNVDIYKKRKPEAENIAPVPYNVLNTTAENKKHFAGASNLPQSV